MNLKYGIIQEEKKERFSIKGLLIVPHKEGSLEVSYPAFGKKYFRGNLKEMQRTYFHPLTKEEISFREPTTSESISASSFDFENLSKKNFFGSGLGFPNEYLQIGKSVITKEGIFINPPRDKRENIIVNQEVLRTYLNKAKKINGIYFVPNNIFEGVNDFGFVPYSSFNFGKQSVKDFIYNSKTNGLARALEHTSNKTPFCLEKISNHYSLIDIPDFDSKFEFSSEPKETTITFQGIFSPDRKNGEYLENLRIEINGWDDFFYGGYAFGVLVKNSEDKKRQINFPEEMIHPSFI